MTEQNSTPNNNPESGIVHTEFLKETETSDKNVLYGDFFATNNDGNIVRKVKSERSLLEIFTNIMSFVMPIVVILAILGGVHVFIKSQEDSTLTENFSFLCGYINYDIDATDEEKWCKTATILQNEFEEKTKKLSADIVEQMAVYLPIKIGAGNEKTSPEKTFIIDTYNEKVNFNTIVEKFEEQRLTFQSIKGLENITCKNLTITAGAKVNNAKLGDTLTVQCEILGGDIGSTPGVNSLGSSRIEAARFIEGISNTTKSSFLVENPPLTLSIEKLNDPNIPPVFKTKTTVTLNMRYIPLESQI